MAVLKKGHGHLKGCPLRTETEGRWSLVVFGGKVSWFCLLASIFLVTGKAGESAGEKEKCIEVYREDKKKV